MASYYEMNDYDFQQVLEAMAGNALVGPDNIKPEPISETVARWRKLFGISQDEAVDRIMSHRNNLTRVQVSDAHWEIIAPEKEAAGFDREAYEHELEMQKKKAALPDLLPAEENSSVTYLVELAGPLNDSLKVKEVAGLQVLPTVVSGSSVEEGREVLLCCIDSTAKVAILRWAANEGGGYEPTIMANPRSLC